jgi:hypothetical protein
MMSTAQTSCGANPQTFATSETISASSFAILIESSVLPFASSTQAQWCVFPMSIPTHTLSRPSATRVSVP